MTTQVNYEVAQGSAQVRVFGPDKDGVYHLERRCGIQLVALRHAGIKTLEFPQICLACLRRNQRVRKMPKWYKKLLGHEVSNFGFDKIFTNVYHSGNKPDCYHLAPHLGLESLGSKMVRLVEIDPQSLQDITEDW